MSFYTCLSGYSHCCFFRHYSFIVVSQNFSFDFIQKLSREEFGLWGSYGVLYCINIDQQQINVINIHIETPRKGFEMLYSSEKGINFQAMARNIKQRNTEAQNNSSIVSVEQPVVLLGDFNMPTNSRIYKDYYLSFVNAFDSKGYGFGYTKFTRFHGVRIDGDHRPLYSDLILKNQ